MDILNCCDFFTIISETIMKISNQQFSFLANEKLEQLGPNILMTVPPAWFPMKKYNRLNCFSMGHSEQRLSIFHRLFRLDKRD